MKAQSRILTLALLMLCSAGTTFAQKSTGPTAVRDVNNPALHPWSDELLISVPAGENSQWFPLAATVPPNQRLVIEQYAGALCYTPAGNYLYGTIEVVTDGLPRRHILAFDGLPFVASGASYLRWVGTGAVRIYADAGSTISLGISKSGNAGMVICLISLSGHLVDVQ